MKSLNRRDFFKLGGGMALSAFVVPDTMLANDGSGFSDFKALVVVDLSGGNDAVSMFVPAESGSNITTGYESYAAVRTSELRIADQNLMPALRSRVDSNGTLLLDTGESNPYGVSGNDIRSCYKKGFYLLDRNGFESKVAINALMPEIAYWMDRGKGAIVQNVGSLIQPTTKAQIRNKEAKLPPFLFAHNQQSLLMKIGAASSINIPTGWLGRVADKWSTMYDGSVYRMNINLSSFGQYKMFFGTITQPMSYSGYGPVSYDHYTAKSLRERLVQQNDGDMFRALSDRTQAATMAQVAQTVTDWQEKKDLFSSNNLVDSYGIAFDKMPSQGDMGINASINEHAVHDFMTAAKLIKILKDKGHKRVVISVAVGGFDQHSTHAKTHAQRIRGVSLGIDRFMRTMEATGLMDDVTLFTVSEFARSAGSNRDGTDHAWGGAYMVLGGAVKPGNYGTFPDLTLNGPDDYSNKGRFIPTTSYSQYFGTILKWFGADAEVLDHALPELKNFSVKDLGFMG